MDIADLIRVEHVVLDLRVRNKAQLLTELGARLAPRTSIAAFDISRALAAREELGATGLGTGFALPHAHLGGLARLCGLFVRLARPIEFQAIDEAPVDLVFSLLIPPDAGQSHVAALAAISRRLRVPVVVQNLRAAASPGDAYQVLTAF